MEVKFTDTCNFPCEIDASNGNLRLSLPWESEGTVYLSQEQVKALLPYLQAFAESGRLKPQESPLQGVDEKIAMTAMIEDPKKRIEALIKLFQEQRAPSTPLQGGSLLEESIKKTASLVRQTGEQEKRIEALEQLVREWRDACYIPLSSALLSDLHERTTQLLKKD